MASATPDLRLPSQPQGITAPWPVPNYAALWQRHVCVWTICPRLKRNGRDMNPRPFESQVQRSNHYATRPHIAWMAAWMFLIRSASFTVSNRCHCNKQYTRHTGKFYDDSYTFRRERRIWYCKDGHERVGILRSYPQQYSNVICHETFS